MMAFVVGALLGVVFSVLGAGGGILAVPVLLIGFKTSVAEATGAGLAVVWVAAIAGAIGHGRAGRLDVRVALTFGLPSVLGAVGGAQLHSLVPEKVTVGLFALVLLTAVAAMFRKKPEAAPTPVATWAIVVAGVATGVLTGFLGVGGGFLIVPALTLWAALPLHRAVGTSMAVIAMSSLSGAVVHLLAGHVPLALVLPMGAGAVVGAVLGAPLSGRLPERPLKIGFAVLASGVALSMGAKALGLLQAG
ncbi:MAG: sulfite exporter TauE/SafE family protein [Myxococcales bacterium]|nr:sulfite exporter TauE/SafE family protein [Myxococcales bacterium]